MKKLILLICSLFIMSNGFSSFIVDEDQSPAGYRKSVDYHSNGAIEKIVIYKDSQVVSTEKYRKDGKLLMKALNTEDKKYVQAREYYDSYIKINFLTPEEDRYALWDDKNSNLRIIASFVNDKKHGTWVEYYPNGQISFSYAYTEDILNGPFIKYNENGTVFQKGNFSSNNLHGQLTEFYQEGMIKLTKNYYDDFLQGKYTTYYKNGNIQMEAFYDKSLPINTTIYYDEKGNVISTIEHVPSNIPDSENSQDYPDFYQIETKFDENKKIRSQNFYYNQFNIYKVSLDKHPLYDKRRIFPWIYHLSVKYNSTKFFHLDKLFFLCFIPFSLILLSLKKVINKFLANFKINSYSPQENLYARIANPISLIFNPLNIFSIKAWKKVEINHKTKTHDWMEEDKINLINNISDNFSKLSFDKTRKFKELLTLKKTKEALILLDEINEDSHFKSYRSHCKKLIIGISFVYFFLLLLKITSFKFNFFIYIIIFLALINILAGFIGLKFFSKKKIFLKDIKEIIFNYTIKLLGLKVLNNKLIDSDTIEPFYGEINELTFQNTIYTKNLYYNSYLGGDKILFHSSDNNKLCQLSIANENYWEIIFYDNSQEILYKIIYENCKEKIIINNVTFSLEEIINLLENEENTEILTESPTKNKRNRYKNSEKNLSSPVNISKSIDKVFSYFFKNIDNSSKRYFIKYFFSLKNIPKDNEKINNFSFSSLELLCISSIPIFLGSLIYYFLFSYTTFSNL